MRIKPPSRKHLLRARSKSFHWWLVDQAPKKFGRIGQLNKFHRRQKAVQGPSEFIKMAIKLDEQYA